MAQVNPLNLSISELTEYDNWRSYQVRFGLDDIFVTVTHNPSIVCYWISKVRYLNYDTPPERVVVGVRTERSYHGGRQRQNHGVDILQLCVKEHCLIYQIGRATDNIPHQLHEFLGDDRFTFVGVRINTLSEILNRYYEIHLGERIVDLGYLCARENNDSSHFYGIKELCNLVLRREYERSALLAADWDALLSEPDLVMYACADVVVCYRAGFSLPVWRN